MKGESACTIASAGAVRVGIAILDAGGRSVNSGAVEADSAPICPFGTIAVRTGSRNLFANWGICFGAGFYGLRTADILRYRFREFRHYAVSNGSLDPGMSWRIHHHRVRDSNGQDEPKTQ